MRGGRKKKASSKADKRLDLIIERVNSENKEIRKVENLTADVIKGKSEPQLRLRK